MALSPLTLAAAAFTLCADAPRTNCVVDGDTFGVNGEKVRLADINAPETHQAGCPAEQALADPAAAGPAQCRVICAGDRRPRH
jgi:endonuclease YncB( thermonuclease family)